MTKRDALAVGIPASGLAIYLVSELGWQSGMAWLIGGVAFVATFAGLLPYWRTNRDRAGTMQDTLNLLPRFKGKAK